MTRRTVALVINLVLLTITILATFSVLRALMLKIGPLTGAITGAAYEKEVRVIIKFNASISDSDLALIEQLGSIEQVNSSAAMLIAIIPEKKLEDLMLLSKIKEVTIVEQV